METIKIASAVAVKRYWFLPVWLLIGLGLILALVTQLYITLMLSMTLFTLLANLTFIFLQRLKPRYNLVICRDHLQYHHPYGGWVLPWHNIRRIDIPKLSRGFSRQEMNYIGLNIESYEKLLDGLSPRFCAHLLTEQRIALLAALRAEQDLNHNEALFESDYFKAQSGKYYTGLIAMYANRMASLRKLTGYDLLIDYQSLDRPKEQVIQLLKTYKQESYYCKSSDSSTLR